MKRIGIITFHNSYNCGSMLESYAILKRMQMIDSNAEIINFRSDGQIQLYNVFNKNNSLKRIIKNILLFPHKKRLYFNNYKYEEFKNNYFVLSKSYNNNADMNDDKYCIVVAGSDQIWNITIADYDDAYFLNWVKKARKVAYAPSFGSKNILKYSNNCEYYKILLNQFDSLSIRENNGKKWLRELTNKDVPVLIDPTLLFDSKQYDKLIDNSCTPKEDYIYFYCPEFNRNLCQFVKKVSKKYNMPVICWSSKSYYIKMIYTYGFKLPKYESPSVYLSLIKNASLIFTTSFHGTIFSTIYRKKFFTLKNGGMYGDDDRVKTLIEQLDMQDRLIEPKYDIKYNYLNDIDYTNYEKLLSKLQDKANNYIDTEVGNYYEKAK